jgi:hypothetical protein
MRRAALPLSMLAALCASAGLLASDAAACSCAAGTPRERLKGASAAFIGTVVAKRRIVPPTGPDGARPEGDDLVYTFRVERWFKRRLPRHVVIRTNSSGASCGFDIRRGARVGLLLYRYHARWESGLCGLISVRDLRRAGRSHAVASRAGGSGCAGG